MALIKLTITPIDPNTRTPSAAPIKVLFNPNAYSITKAVTWNAPTNNKPGNETQRKFNAPLLEFGGGDSRQLSLELFYDVTEPIGGALVPDVRQLTNEIVKLTRIEKSTKHPPICRVDWGASPPPDSDFPFEGVITNLTQRFTLFTSDGRPLRATLTVAFKEHLPLTKAEREVDPESTSRIIRQGDSLSSIAAEVYRNPALWRVIAEANKIDDPRILTLGRRLSIPKLG